MTTNTSYKSAAINRLRILLKPHGRVLALGIGILFTMLPVTLLVPVLKELVGLRYQVSAFWNHFFMSGSLIGAILFAPLAGYLVDRLPRQRIIFVALVANAICFAGMALAPSFTWLMVFRFIEGAFHITALTAWMATAADQSREGRTGRMMGAVGGMIILGVTIGVPLGGVIAGNDAVRVLWVAVLFSLIAAGLGFLPVVKTPQRHLRGGLSEYRQLIRTHRWLLIPYAYTFIDRLCIGVVVTTFTLFMTDILLLTPAERGIELSYFLIPFAFLCYPVGRIADRIGFSGLMAGGSLLFGVVLMTYGYLNAFWLPFAMVASGILSAAMFAPTLALNKLLTEARQHGLAFSGYNIAGSLGFVVGPLLGGSLFTLFSAGGDVLGAYQQTFIITGAFEVLCAIVSLPFLLRLNRRVGLGAPSSAV